MAIEVTMPQMGADMTEGTLVKWLKQIGDQVTRGDIIAGRRLVYILCRQVPRRHHRPASASSAGSCGVYIICRQSRTYRPCPRSTQFR